MRTMSWCACSEDSSCMFGRLVNIRDLCSDNTAFAQSSFLFTGLKTPRGVPLALELKSLLKMMLPACLPRHPIPPGFSLLLLGGDKLQNCKNEKILISPFRLPRVSAVGNRVDSHLHLFKTCMLGKGWRQQRCEL